jgi:hypothetical protein
VEAIKVDLPITHTYTRVIQELTVEQGTNTLKNASEPRVNRFEEILNGKKTSKVTGGGGGWWVVGSGWWVVSDGHGQQL